MRKFYFIICISLLLSFSAKAQLFSLLKDINPGTEDAMSYSQFARMNGMFYFLADNGLNGRELWKSDGTTAGTVMIKDINNSGSWGSNIHEIIVVGDHLYFSAATEAQGWELWKSDGTAAGTVMVKDIEPVNTPGVGTGPIGLAAMGNTIFFYASDPVHGRELWKSDGTAAGTVLVKDVNPGVADSQPEYLTPVGNTLYFTATTAANGRELWKSDGTTAGTMLVSDLKPGVEESEISNLVNLNNTLVFRASFGTEEITLMKTDGTAAGTVVVKPGNIVTGINWLKNVNGTLFFTSSGDEVWKSDGTAAGTVMLKDIRPGQAITKGALEIQNVNGKVFFAANDGTHGYELWVSDGTPSGTVMVKDINPGSPGSNPQSGGVRFYEVGNYAIFQADDAVHGRELWVSDGTADGTYLLEDVNPGSAGSDPYYIIEVKGRIFVTFDTPLYGKEIWTACVCFQKKDIRDPETLVSLYPSPLRESGTLLICVTEPEVIHYSIYDAAGRLMQTHRTSLNAGSNLIPLQTVMLAGGAYFLSIKGERTVRNLKFLKQ